MRRAHDQISVVKPFEGRLSDSCRDPATDLPDGDASQGRRCANTRSTSENNCVQSSHSPLARALEAPLRGARFDGYTLPVTPERVKSWITRRFHREIVSSEPSDAQSALCARVSECASSCSPPGESARRPVARGSFRRLRGSGDAGAIFLVDRATVPPPHDVSRAVRCASTRSAPAQTCVEALVHPRRERSTPRRGGLVSTVTRFQ